MKRAKLSQRSLPNYTAEQERMNTLTHGIGFLAALAAPMPALNRAAASGSVSAVVGVIIFCLSMAAMYAVSSVYHGLKPGLPKKVMQVIDHCTIYFLIAGTYTPILLSSLLPSEPVLAWGMLLFQWSLAIVATVLTAIDLKKYSIFSMLCYIGMGWAILPFWRQILNVLTVPGFALLLSGGIAYTVGSVLYGLGKRRNPWMHTVFHVFVLLGTALQYLAVVFYAL